MPVRSRGSLLAGTVALVSLCTAGIGCQSSPFADHDSFALQGGSGHPPLRLFPMLHRGDRVVTNAGQMQTIASYTPAPANASVPVTFQRVPGSQVPANHPAVIASSWQPVQRVNAEQWASAPEMHGPAAPAADARVVPVRTPPNLIERGMNDEPAPHSITLVPRAPSLDAPPADPAPSKSATLPAPRTLEPSHSAVNVAAMPAHPEHAPSMPREFDKQTLPPYVVEPPDILLIQASPAVTINLQALEGQHLVAPDGTINLGIYGKILVAGMTLDQVADAVAARLLELLPGLAQNKNVSKEDKEKYHPLTTIERIKSEMQVDVLSYNSKYYYVITDGGGYGQQVYPILNTGNETVLDAVAKVNGLPAVASKKKVWVARATRAGQPPKILPVDWRGITMRGSADTNYQVFPGDRIYVGSDPWIRADSWLAKRLSPLLRGFGATLLGASTVNTIKNGTNFGGIPGTGVIR